MIFQEWEIPAGLDFIQLFYLQDFSGQAVAADQDLPMMVTVIDGSEVTAVSVEVAVVHRVVEILLVKVDVAAMDIIEAAKVLKK
jgi:hypothetical protein